MIARITEKHPETKTLVSNFAFKMITMMHDNPLLPLLVNPFDQLKSAGLQANHRVVEVGCGPGFYTVPASKIVGANGMVYALDLNPRAIARVKQKVADNGFNNVTPILANASNTGLADQSVDVAFFFGLPRIAGGLENVLVEMNRILIPGGTIAFKNSQGSTKRLIRKLEKQGMSHVHRQSRITRFHKH